jgi:hypothetical protein
MHILDCKWTDLAAGYQVVQSFQTKLTTEFGRAVQVGHKQRFRKELTEWHKKRRVFFALVAMAPLSIITLCMSAFYLRDMTCVIVYWAVLVVTILVTLAVAGRQYIREMVNGRPVQQAAEGWVVDLEGRWWDSLVPEEKAVEKAGNQGKNDFLVLLARSLPDTYLAVRSPLAPNQETPDPDALLLGPSGIWLFEVNPWNGMVLKQDGIWKQIQIIRDKLGRKRNEEKVFGLGPDDRWLQQKQKIAQTLKKLFPEQAWTLELIQGGVAFSHPKAILDKNRIQDNTAAYGSAKAWVERIRRAPEMDGFTLEMQLKILDALTGAATVTGSEVTPPVSSKEEAERLSQDAVEELRAYVARMVK